MNKKLEILAHLVKCEQQGELVKTSLNLGPNYIDVRLVPGPKYTKLDIKHGGQWSGSLMIDAEGNIYGIKGYGTIHRGHAYGNLDTIEKWYWGRYYPTPRPSNWPAPVLSEPESPYTVGDKPQAHPLQVADILVGSWGYDQTNIDFYQVVTRTDKSVTFQELNQERTTDSTPLAMSGTCTPIAGSGKTPQLHTRRVDVDDNGKPFISFCENGKGTRVILEKWSGNPRRWSDYA